jgi:flagellar basal-body rod modification protein FlgD
MSSVGLTGTLTDANKEVLERLQNDVENKAKLENQQLGKDAFLKLMMTQLAHQDPLEPLNNEQMISQMAEFTSVEQMGMMSTAAAKQVEQNVQIIDALKAISESTGSTQTDKKMEELINKTDLSNELNTKILDELIKLNAAQKTTQAYE